MIIFPNVFIFLLAIKIKTKDTSLERIKVIECFFVFLHVHTTKTAYWPSKVTNQMR